MWGAIIQAIDHAAERINKGAGAGIEVAKSQSGGAAGSSGSSGTADTTVFGKAVQTATNNIKDKLASLNNNPKVEKAETEEEKAETEEEKDKAEGAENGTEKTEGTI